MEYVFHALAHWLGKTDNPALRGGERDITLIVEFPTIEAAAHAERSFMREIRPTDLTYAPGGPLRNEYHGIRWKFTSSQERYAQTEDIAMMVDPDAWPGLPVEPAAWYKLGYRREVARTKAIEIVKRLP